ncbi:MAG: hypothetical protein SFX73_01675 [Kofleriaceae bacterium]|nr:hypothetical protein [Kofleriaceae bacterium]
MIVQERLELLIVARLAYAPASKEDELSRALQRFAPTALSANAWRDTVAHHRAQLAEVALAQRLGASPPRTWKELADCVLPALALGISATDGKAHKRLKQNGAWPAAIGGRLLGVWTTGAPPTLSTVCDAYVWRQLGLGGRPKRCPSEIRALFIQRELGIDAAPPDRLLRLYIARELRAPRPEAGQLRDALVRAWLDGQNFDQPTPRAQPDFAHAVRDATQALERGVFGDRKVFIAAAFDALRTHPAWTALTLDAFKQRLLVAHRAGELVLERADFVAAMDPAVVAASELVADGARFHFVVREATS